MRSISVDLAILTGEETYWRRIRWSCDFKHHVAHFFARDGPRGSIMELSRFWFFGFVTILDLQRRDKVAIFGVKTMEFFLEKLT